MESDTVSEVFDSEFMAKLEKLSLLAKRILGGASRGRAPAARIGSSVEFHDLRRYSPGDDFRYIDWNAFARLDELFLKLFQEEGDVCLYLLIDGSASMGFGSPSKLVYAQRLAAALAYIALSNLDIVSTVMLYEGESRGVKLLKGKQQIFKIFSFLEGQSAEGRTSLDEALRKFGLEAKHSGQLVLISDLMDDSPFTDGLHYLKHLGFDVKVVQVLSREEIDPQVGAGTTVSDSETRERISVTDVSAYARERKAFFDSLEKECTEAAISYFWVSTETPFEDLVLKHLREHGFYERRRGQMRVSKNRGTHH